MTRQLHTLRITVELKAPWLIHGSAPGSYGLDAVQLCGPDGGRILPGTLLTGRLREAWNELRTVLGETSLPDPAVWFGQAANGEMEPHRSRLWVDDLVETPKDGANPYWPSVRVGISDQTGAGDEGMLQFIEQKEPPGTPIRFEGIWRVICTQTEAETLRHAIRKGLSWHTQLGALRNVGFGELVSVAVEEGSPNLKALTQEHIKAFVNGDPTSDKRASRGLLLRFHQALCVSTKTINGNTFVSGDVIPGSALKGALATLLRAQGKDIPTWFDAMRITHALPAHGMSRPAPLPLSLVAQKVGDAWHILDAMDSEAALGDGRSLPYQSDWKDPAFAAATESQGWGQTQRHLRVRTAIERGRAKNNDLFAYDCVLASPDESGRLTHWLAQVDLGPEDTPKHWEELAEIVNHGSLGPIGKTDAFAELHLLPVLESAWASRRPDSTELTVLLVSDALLFATSQVTGHTSAKPIDIRTIYESAFQDMAAQCLGGLVPDLSLLSFHATQRLAGGRYLHGRHMASKRATYQPYVLSEAGSVFRLAFRDLVQARLVAQAWLTRGLPLPTAVADEHGCDWKSNTYIPQNGWGEVLVNPEHGFEPLGDLVHTSERTPA
jgi:hypothetical protein